MRIQALVAILEESASGSNISRKATLLIGEVLQIANKVLPLGVASNLQVRSIVWCGLKI